MPNFKNRRGSQIVEATMVLPVTILICMALIGLIMSFYFQLLRQIEQHEAERNQMYQVQEVSRLRIQDTISNAAGSALEELEP